MLPLSALCGCTTPAPAAAPGAVRHPCMHAVYDRSAAPAETHPGTRHSAAGDTNSVQPHERAYERTLLASMVGSAATGRLHSGQGTATPRSSRAAAASPSSPDDGAGADAGWAPNGAAAGGVDPAAEAVAAVLLSLPCRSISWRALALTRPCGTTTPAAWRLMLLSAQRAKHRAQKEWPHSVSTGSCSRCRQSGQESLGAGEGGLGCSEPSMSMAGNGQCVGESRASPLTTSLQNA